MNAGWWKYVSDFQGIEPPSPRGEEFYDAATKTHINDTPAYYYNYAFATVFKFQLHDYIARKILHQPPQSCNYADNKEVGVWLNNILKKGGTEDWRKVLKEATGEDISTRAMKDYFQPLMSWLEEQRPPGWLVGATAGRRFSVLILTSAFDTIAGTTRPSLIQVFVITACWLCFLLAQFAAPAPNALAAFDASSQFAWA
jgi:hypothetical protein